jgi:hypothetical protein
MSSSEHHAQRRNWCGLDVVPAGGARSKRIVIPSESMHCVNSEMINCAVSHHIGLVVGVIQSRFSRGERAPCMGRGNIQPPRDGPRFASGWARLVRYI